MISISKGVYKNIYTVTIQFVELQCKCKMIQIVSLQNIVYILNSYTY